MIRQTSFVLIACASIALVSAAGCSVESTDEPSASGGAELTSPGPAAKLTYCGVATFEGPSYYAQNFATYAEAKNWLSTLSQPLDSRIDSGACARPIPCPMLYAPICGSVSGAEAQTYGNACELLAATRNAAGAAPPGSAKGAWLHDGECKTEPPPPADVCAGQKCGAPCPSMFGSPLPTFCNAKGECAPGTPICGPTYDCDRSHVKCDAPEPACADGWTVSVLDGCYGPCVPKTQCGGPAVN